MKGLKLSQFKSFNSLGLEVPILESDLGFRDSLGLGGDSTRGATRLPCEFSKLSFYLENFLLYSYFLINCFVYIFNLLLYLISHLIYNLIILFSL